MTTTSAGPHGFHVKPIATVLAVAALVAATIVVAQQVGRDTPQSVPAPIEASVEPAVPYTGPNGLTQAFANGKFDAGLLPAPSQAATGSVPVPQLIPVAGQGGLYDALIAGKFATDFRLGDPGVEYVRSPDAAPSVGGLSAAFDAGKLDAGLANSEPTAKPSPPATYTPTVSGGHQQ